MTHFVSLKISDFHLKLLVICTHWALVVWGSLMVSRVGLKNFGRSGTNSAGGYLYDTMFIPENFRLLAQTIW